jgi:predicted Zn-dependent protease
MRRAAVFIVLLLFSSGRGIDKLPADMHELVVASIDCVFKEKFKQAEEEAKKIIKKYPEHPAGYFFCAAAVEAWMRFYETDKREEEFYRYCDMAIDKSENLIEKEPDNAWAMFFKGGADGYKGTYESRYERWITSFRHGWKGVSTLQSLIKKFPDMQDVKYGLGMYDYWRSAFAKMLWWMPGIANRCEQGIAELFEAKKDGLYTGYSAAASLITIFCNERRYKEAETLADEMLTAFPGSLAATWGKAKALFGEERYDEAEKMFRDILSRVEAEPFDNHYNAVCCHLWLARIYLKMKRYTQSIAECNRMGYYNLDEDIKTRLDKMFSEANKIKEQAKAANLKNPEAEVVP